MSKLLLPLLLSLVTPLATQDEASTLARLTDRADAIAVVRALTLRDVNGPLLGVVFATQRVLHGEVPGTFELREPVQRGCGRALFGVLPGAAHLAFLRRHEGGWQLVHSGARALPALEPQLVPHVESLLRASDPARRARLLGAALASETPRIRTDAALALAHQPGLEGLAAELAGPVALALAPALRQHDPAAASLVTAAVRTHSAPALELLVGEYLAGRLGALAPLALAAAPAIDAAHAADLVSRALPQDSAGQQRALTLLAEVPGQAARSGLLALARSLPDDAACVRAAALALQSGVPDEDLAAATSSATAAAARRFLAQQASQAPRFRVVRPGASR